MEICTMYMNTCLCILGLLYVTLSVGYRNKGDDKFNLEFGAERVKQPRYDDSPVERALHYVFKDRNESCTVGTEDILPLEFDHTVWSEFTDPAIRTANLLTKLLVVNNGSLDSLSEDMFFLMVRNNVHGDSLIFGSAIALETGVYSKYDIFCPYAYKKNHSVRSHDLSVNYNYLDPSTEWYNSVKLKSWQNVTKVTDGIMYRHNNTLLPEVEEMYPLAQLKDGHWTLPYYDCGGGNIWMVTYSSPIFTISHGDVYFQGVATIDIELQNIDINQCDPDDHMSSTGLDVFRGTHKCQPTTRCVPVTGLGFVTGAYNCWCKEGFFFPVPNGLYFSGRELETFFQEDRPLEPHMFRCVVCAPGCDDCVDQAPCMVPRDQALMIVLSLLMVLVILGIAGLATLTYFFRSEMVFKSASPIFLQLMCLGGGLACLKFFFLFPQTSRITCILRMWPMHTGFVIMYGSLIVKTWRVSVIFTVGTKKRVRLPDRKLLKRISLITLVTVSSLAVWTGISPPDIHVYKNDTGLKFVTCDFGIWEYAALGAEIIFLLYGVYLCFTVRKAPAHFNESRHITWAVYNAIILGSFMAFTSSFIEPLIGPNLSLVLKFIQIQVYVTFTLALIFVPKFYKLYKKVDITANGDGTQPVVGGFQTVTGRVKVSQVAPRPVPKISTASQTAESSTYFDDTASSRGNSFILPFGKSASHDSLSSCNRYTSTEATRRIAKSLVPFAETMARRGPVIARQRANSSIIDRSNVEVPISVRANSLLPYLEKSATNETLPSQMSPNSSIIHRVTTRTCSFPSLDRSDSFGSVSSRDKARSSNKGTKTTNTPVRK